MLYLEYRRDELRLRQHEVARRARLHRVILSGIENGRINPTGDELSRLAAVLDVRPPEALLEAVRIVRPEALSA